MHFIVLSRFNCVQRHVKGEQLKARMDNLRFNATWMVKRVELMKHFTAPSLQSQTDDNYSWYVLVQEGTPETIVEAIKELGARVVNVTIDDVDAAQRLVRTRRGAIATVNLDTDDAIAPTFLERIREEINGKRDETLVFLRGFRYRPLPAWAVGVKQEVNDFVIRFEKRAEKAKTVFDPVEIDKIVDSTRPMWLQTVHGSNATGVRLQRARKDKNSVTEVGKLFNIVPMPYSQEPGMQRTAYGRYISNEGR